MSNEAAPLERRPGAAILDRDSWRLAAAIAAVGCLLAVGCAGSPTSPSAASAGDQPKKFIVMLEGSNFIFDDGGRPARLGFVTTLHIVARTAEEAESRAIRQVREDPTLNDSIVNARSNPPRIEVTRHFEVESFTSDRSADLGYIFYEDRRSR